MNVTQFADLKMIHIIKKHEAPPYDKEDMYYKRYPWYLFGGVSSGICEKWYWYTDDMILANACRGAIFDAYYEIEKENKMIEVVKHEDWKDRLREEYEELNVKCNKLSDFIVSENFENLDETNQKLLCEQWDIMMQYLAKLKCRMILNNIKE